MYKNFIGIDIGKTEFVVSLNCIKKTESFSNDAEGIETFVSQYNRLSEDGFFILETTGGYELSLLLALCNKGFSVHRANTRKVKNFIRSYGNTAKTDRLDAIALSRYGKERHLHLSLFEKPSEQALELFDLVQRRMDLVALKTAEKNRARGPRIGSFVKKSCAKMLAVLEEEIAELHAEIEKHIDEDPVLQDKKRVLKTVPGIGDISAYSFLILMPELGSLNKKQIAALAGVAPISNESGTYKGYRSTGHGRDGIKSMLFMCAMAARRSHSPLQSFYNRKVEEGKPNMVALVALMRKIIVIANTRLKELAEEKNTAVS